MAAGARVHAALPHMILQLVVQSELKVMQEVVLPNTLNNKWLVVLFINICCALRSVPGTFCSIAKSGIKNGRNEPNFLVFSLLFFLAQFGPGKLTESEEVLY